MKNTILLFTFLAIIIISLATAFIFYKGSISELGYGMFSSNNLNNQIIETGDSYLEGKNKEVLASTDPNNLKTSVYEEQKKYQENIDFHLKNDSLSEDEKRLLLLRKAASLGTARSNEFELSEYLEASKILRDQLFNDKYPNDFYKSIASAVLLRTYSQWCFDGKSLANLLTQNDYYQENISAIEKVYKDKQLSVMILFSNFANNNSTLPKLDSDKFYQSEISKINAMLLRAYRDDLDSKTKNEVVSRLEQGLELYRFATPQTVITQESGVIDPMLSYALSFDIYNSYIKSSDSKINQQIDKNYKDLFKVLETYEGGKKPSMQMINMLTTIYYTDSLNRRYTNAKDQAYKNSEEKRVVDNFILSLDKAEMFLPFMATFLRDGMYGNSTWEKMKNNFITLGRKYPELKKYFISIGIKESDIDKKVSDWSKK